MLTLYAVAAGIAYQMPRHFIPREGFNAAGVAAVGIFELMAFGIALQTTPRNLDPLTVAAVLTAAACAAGVTAGIRTRRDRRPMTMTSGYRAIRLRDE